MDSDDENDNLPLHMLKSKIQQQTYSDEDEDDDGYERSRGGHHLSRINRENSPEMQEADEESSYRDDYDDEPIGEMKQETKIEPVNEMDECESDSDDDLPLVSRLKKREPVMLPTPRKRAPKTTRAKRQTKQKATKVKKPARTQTTKKKEEEPTRKYERPGQRRETPPDNDSARLFYSSMYREKRKLGLESNLADSWMLRHGLLSDAEIKRVMNRWK